MTNPLLTLQFEIPFGAIRAEHVEPAIDALIEDAQRRIDAVAERAPPLTYANTLAALEEATETLEWAATVASHLESVATTPAFRAAYEAIQPMLSRFWTGIILDDGVWRTLRAYADTDEARALTGARRRHLDKTLDEFRRHGAELDADKKAEVREISVTLAERTTTFSQNVLDATNAFELIVEDRDRLAGLPPGAVEAAAESAAAKGRSGWRFTLQAPSLIPVLTYLDDRDIRETVWRAHTSRGTSPDLDNRPLIEEILRLRRQKAELLGFDDFADLTLADRMAGSGDVARTFVDDLRARTVAAFERENRALEEFRRESAPGDAGPLRPWDVAYYAEKQRRADYDFDEEELRPYFPAERVLDGLFETMRCLYDIRVTPTDALPVWDAAVRTYTMHDTGGEHLASFYVDLYPRENKRDGAWMHGLITATPPAPHLALFCANTNPPVGDKPALLTHREVETLFHEFGHLLHHCFSRVPVRSLAGTNVPWDWVELPSQIMENWCWEREALDLFARHYETGARIPEDLFRKMQRVRTYRAANAQMRQLGYAATDLALHRRWDPARDPDVVAYATDVLREYAPADLPDDYGFVASFSHLFASPVGYAAGYYSYKWAEVLDADAFTRFRDAGVFDRQVGMAFRREILERGDSADPLDLYRAFMGRDPELEPLLERQGIA